MQENMPTAAFTRLAGPGGQALARHGEPCEAGQVDERWPPLHCTLFITGSALACWGVLISLAALILG